MSSRPDQAIFLISVTITYDELGNPVETPVERMVFAEELAVFSSEFYNAAVTGLRPSKKFEIYTREYQGEAKLKHDGITYSIIRTSMGKTPEKTWLVCERVAADG